MAKFTPSQIDINRINGGNRYQNGDYPTPETFNAPIEAAIFAQSLATNQPNVENANNIGVPSVNIEQVTDGGVRFVFSNLKGEKGQDGKDHSQEIASLNSQIYTANDKISRLTKEVSNLESQLNPDLIVFDKKIAYAKEVPIRSAPYAEITKFGGMSYAVDGELRHAKPTAFKSVGANKFNPQWLLNTGYDVTITDDGFYRGQCSWFYAAYGQAPAQIPITDFKENTSYTIQFEGYSENLNVATLGFQFYYTDGTSNYSPFITGTTNKKYSVVTDSNKTLQKIIITYSDGDYVRIKNICIIEGDVAEYVPYTEHTLAIPTAVLEKFDGHGKGRVYNFIDWSAKKYHKVYGAVDLGTLDWTLSDTFYATVSDKEAGISNILCAKYENADTPFSQMPDKSITGNEIYSLIYIKDSAYTDAATFKSAMQGVMLIYELATPEVTDISDILPDDNLIAVEGGGTIIVENDYRYDVPSEITYQLRSAT